MATCPSCQRPLPDDVTASVECPACGAKLANVEPSRIDAPEDNGTVEIPDSSASDFRNAPAVDLGRTIVDVGTIDDVHPLPTLAPSQPASAGQATVVEGSLQFDIHSLPSSSWQTMSMGPGSSGSEVSSPETVGGTFELGDAALPPSANRTVQMDEAGDSSSSGAAGKTMDLNAPLSVDGDFSLAPGVEATAGPSGQTIAFDSISDLDDIAPAAPVAPRASAKTRESSDDAGRTFVLGEAGTLVPPETPEPGRTSATLEVDQLIADAGRTVADVPAPSQENRGARTMVLDDVAELSELSPNPAPGNVTAPDAAAMAGRTFVLGDEVVEKIARDTLDVGQLPKGMETDEIPDATPRKEVPKAAGTIALDAISNQAAAPEILPQAGTVPDVPGQHQPLRRAGLVVRTRSLRKPHEQTTREGDYELLKLLGEGGMGVVYTARQSSIHRTVAVKMIKPGSKVDDIQKQKFLAEAVVTGDLEHPNIVPIYDLGTNEQGALFYSMKKVQGTPWDKTIKQKSLPENIEILMKVADAIAFAHSKHVIHRDLKPENVMLGAFGEVLVMDWGLAISVGKLKEAGLRQALNMGGTPAYMAPEMVTGPFDRIGAHSDVYLLAAILFEIVTGDPPHTGTTPMKCLHAAARNEIRPTEKSGELMGIARRGMATKPEERYASVIDFQNAIREYQSHAESIFLTNRAESDLQKAQTEGTYERFSRSVFGFQEALVLWQGNTRAKQQLSQAQLGYARCALQKEDFDLGLSVLDEKLEQHTQVGNQLRAAKRERESRNQRLKTLRRMALYGTTLFVLVVIGAFFWIRSERDIAEENRIIAETQRTEAQNQKKVADEQRAVAVKEKEAAEVARAEEAKARSAEAVARKQEEAAKEKEIAARKDAVKAKEREEYEAYIAQIGLAAAKIEENEFGSAREILQNCKPELRNWEWGRLMHLCSQGLTTLDAAAPLDAVAFANDGSFFVTGGWNGSAQVWRQGGEHPALTLPVGTKIYVHSVAVSPDNATIATGGSDRQGWVRLWEAKTGKPIERKFAGHSDTVLSVAFSPDGKKLLTSSYDKTARVWNVKTGELLTTLRGHTWWVWQAAFSNDGKQIVTVSQDGTALVWTDASGDWTAPERIRKSPPFAGHQGAVYTAAFSPDGSLVASGGYDKRVLVWKPSELKPVDFTALSRDANAVPASRFTPLDGHLAAVRSVSFSPDGRFCLSGAHDNTVKAWDVAAGKIVKTFRGHDSWVRGCRFSPDGEKIVSVGYDHKVKLWSVSAYGEERVLRGYVLQGHADAILAANFSPDEKQIVTASRDNSARTWDVASGRELQQFQEGHMFLVSRAQFTRDGRQLFTSAVDNTVRQWDIATGTQLRRFDDTGRSAVLAVSPGGNLLVTGSNRRAVLLWNLTTESPPTDLVGHSGEITAAAFSPDGTQIVTGDDDAKCIVWDVATGKRVSRFSRHTRTITGLAFLPGQSGANRRILSSSRDNTVANWDAQTGKEDPGLVLKHRDEVSRVALLADGHAVTACKDNLVRIWDVASARVIGTVSKQGETTHEVVASADGRRFLTVDFVSRIARVYDAQTRQEILFPAVGKGEGQVPFFTPESKLGLVTSAAFSPDGTSIATVGGRDARLWDARTGRELMSFTPHGTVASANFSPDGKRLVTGFWDNSARVWDLEPGRPGLKLGGKSADGKESEGHSAFVNSACFSPDGKWILTASDDRTAKLWDADTGRLIRTFKDRHRHRVRSAVFSADGKKVLTASADTTARIWDAATGKELRELAGHKYGILCAVFSKDGQLVATGSDDNSARIWNAETGKVLSVLEGHTAAVTSVTFSPDGHRLLTGSQDFLTKLWDADTSKEILTLKGHSQEVTSVAFGPTGRYALTGSRDGTAIIWLASDWHAAAAKEKHARLQQADSQ